MVSILCGTACRPKILYFTITMNMHALETMYQDSFKMNPMELLIPRMA